VTPTRLVSRATALQKGPEEPCERSREVCLDPSRRQTPQRPYRALLARPGVRLTRHHWRNSDTWGPDTRAAVSGKPGIKVDGVTVGIEDGKTVIPYFRFPGETSYTQGSARPVVTADEFMWQHKTGKKFYAYVTSYDGAVQSNRVIIAAN
jgi:hypothetical protein